MVNNIFADKFPGDDLDILFISGICKECHHRGLLNNFCYVSFGSDTNPAGKNLFKVRKITLEQRSVILLTLNSFGRLGWGRSIQKPVQSLKMTLEQC